MMKNIVTLTNITIDYQMKKYDIRAVTDVDFAIKKGKITALVGESGSGKSTLASSIILSISEPGKVTNGTITFHDHDEDLQLNNLKLKQENQYKWERVSIVFQAAQSALNPVMTIADQFIETAKDHGKTDMQWIKHRMEELLSYVKLDAKRVLNAYPHELSGGMKQRVMIAFAMLLNPDLIILDEPTTALDVITQDYIFSILRQINKDFGISMLLLTHDIGVVAKYSDYVGVMYAGRIMEYGETKKVFTVPAHPYTEGLIKATPSLYTPLDDMGPIPGTPPDLRQLPKGCVFSPRCKYKTDKCSDKEPDTMEKSGHLSKCIFDFFDGIKKEDSQ